MPLSILRLPYHINVTIDDDATRNNISDIKGEKRKLYVRYTVRVFLTETATFAAGCFWGVEDTFRQIHGVSDVLVGYTGGTIEHPNYEQVCTGTSGHAEAVEVTYDPKIVSYEQLLEVFFANHNPTTVNQQGPDFGEQYRSAIFYHSDVQKHAAEDYVEALEKSGKWKRPIVTQIAAAVPFYKAEEYHQQYLKKNGLGSCHT